MYAIAGCVGCIYVVLYFLSRREACENCPSGLLRPFYRIAHYLYRKVCLRKLFRAAGRQVERDLEGLNPGGEKEQLRIAYYVKKLALSLLICFVGTLLGVVVRVQAEMMVLLTEKGSVPRGKYTEERREITVKTTLKETGEQIFTIPVEVQGLSREEAELLEKLFWEQLPQLILGENMSLGQVFDKLCLEEGFDGFPFEVEWKSSRPDLVSESGEVFLSEGKEEKVQLTAIISYGEWQWEEVVEIWVMLPVMEEEDRLHKELEELLLLSEQTSRRDEEWKLPDSFYGEKLSWQQVVEDNSLLLWVLALVVAAAVYLFSDKDLHGRLLEKRAEMKRAYPDVVHKLALYLGAGMTIRGAFQRMSSEADSKKANAIYQEVRYTCRALQIGVPESDAYENFGKRTGLQEYIRLSTLLTQNLKKGNADLLSRLQEEVHKAAAEQLQCVRRLIEEAGTKLLLPMIMMLAVVMIMIMLPAFYSMGV